METKYFSVKEVADKLGVTIYPVREYIKSGKLKAVKLGRSYRISEEMFNEFIKKNLTIHEQES